MTINFSSSLTNTTKSIVTLNEIKTENQKTIKNKQNQINLPLAKDDYNEINIISFKHSFTKLKRNYKAIIRK